jgi:hypothetical protein
LSFDGRVLNQSMEQLNTGASRVMKFRAAITGSKLPDQPNNNDAAFKSRWSRLMS